MAKPSLRGTTATALAVAAVAVFAIAIAAAAKAGSAGTPVAAPAPAVPAVPRADIRPDWTGFYGGVEIGYGDFDSNLPGLGGDDVIGGLTLGYDYDFGDWVLGGALDLDWGEVALAPGISLDQVFRAKLRGGYKIGNGLIYATGGYANFDTSGLGDADGYFIGGGYEHRISDHFSLGGEVLYHESDNFSGTATDLEATTVQLRAVYRF